MTRSERAGVPVIRKPFSLARCSRHTNMMGTDRFTAIFDGTLDGTSAGIKTPQLGVQSIQNA